MRASRPPEDRFNEKVEIGRGCWWWLGTKDRDGYGLFKLNTHTCIGAHRYAWWLATGENPKGHLICHYCDNPGCVNPEHLFMGTAQDNNRDRDEKGRTAKGERHHNFGRGKPFQYKLRFATVPPLRPGEKNGRAKLTEAQVREVLADNRPSVRLAEELGVTPTAIGMIRRGKTWRHLLAEDRKPA